MRVGAASLLVLSLLLAGCSSSAGSNGGELVVTSQVPTEEDTQTATSVDPVTEEPKKGTRGHIAGVVVDEAIRPIQGAVVRLPGMDLTDKTDRNGAFSFADLHVGPYLMQANASEFYAAETVVTVKSDEFSRVKFVLTAVPPPEPFQRSQKFDGFADITDISTFTFISSCNTCYFDFYAGGPGFQALVVEAFMEEYSGAGAGTVGSNNFYHMLRESSNGPIRSSGDLANPMRLDLRVEPLAATETSYRLTLRPESFPAPEVNKAFEIFVTQFYNSVPDPTWSFIEDDD